MNNVDKYYWIIYHPNMTNDYGSKPVIELTPHMVNPNNNTIEPNNALNAKQQWWIEVNVPRKEFDPKVSYPHENSFEFTHDWNLDCGGDSAEEAIDKLYNLVIEHYGNY